MSNRYNRNLEWLDHAACRQYDPGWWFPKPHESSAPAVHICVNECPVRVSCLRYTARLAVEGHSMHGIWAGLIMRTFTTSDARDILRTFGD